MVRFTSRTTDIDNGEKDVKKTIEEIKRHPYVEIGLLEVDAQQTKQSRDAAGSKTKPPTLLEVATWNEFGTANDQPPERSFIRATVDANESKYFAIIDSLRDKVLRRKMTITAALGILGQKIQADIVNRINAGIAPANAPSTIAAKGSSKPLIDTGQLKQSIRYNVSQGD